MSSHGKADSAANSPLWALMQLKAEPSAVGEAVVTGTTASSNQTTLFEDTTADAWISGQTIGLFNYGTSETQGGKIAHTGWVLKTTGSGGRAARVQYQTLVCLTDNPA